MCADDLPYLRAFGLDHIVTHIDDPLLWEALLSKYFPNPSAPDGFHYDPWYFHLRLSKIKQESPPMVASILEGYQTRVGFNSASSIHVAGLSFRILSDTGRVQTIKKARFLGLLGSGVVKVPILQTTVVTFMRVDPNRLRIRSDVEKDEPFDLRFRYPKVSLTIHRPTRGISGTVVDLLSLIDADGGIRTSFHWKRDKSGKWLEAGYEITHTF